MTVNNLFNKFDKGESVNSAELTFFYNQVFNKQERNTNCGTCLRHRLLEIRTVYDRLTKEDIGFLKWTLTLEENHYPDFDRVIDIYNRVFKKNEPYTHCLVCINKKLNQLYGLIK